MSSCLSSWTSEIGQKMLNFQLHSNYHVCRVNTVSATHKLCESDWVFTASDVQKKVPSHINKLSINKWQIGPIKFWLDDLKERWLTLTGLHIENVAAVNANLSADKILLGHKWCIRFWVQEIKRQDRTDINWAGVGCDLTVCLVQS